MKSNHILITLSILLLSSCSSLPEDFRIIHGQQPYSQLSQFGREKLNEESYVLPLSAYSHDNTEYLQSLFNSSDYSSITIPKTDEPWYTEPLSIHRDDLTIIFEKGASIEAIKGGFQNNDDCLLTIRDQRNITILGDDGDGGFIMQKKDYQSSSYNQGEWRHGLYLLSVENIWLEGITISRSGGDGIYVGRAGGTSVNYCKNINIINCRLMDNHRQGISIISVEDLLIKDTLCWNTWGTSPRAGIDFEPNRANERLINCRMDNCWFEKNGGPGIHIYLGNFNETSLPFDITIENCTSKNNLLFIALNILNINNNPRGKIILLNNEFKYFNNIPRKGSIEIIEE